MELTKTLRRLSLFFAISLSFLGCEFDLGVESSSAKEDSAPVVQQVEGKSENEPVVPVEHHYRLMKQILWIEDHRDALRRVECRSDKVQSGLSVIQQELLSRRFSRLSRLARRYHWTESRGPRKGSSRWEQYREWLLLRSCIEASEMRTCLQNNKGEYKPSWMK